MQLHCDGKSSWSDYDDFRVTEPHIGCAYLHSKSQCPSPLQAAGQASSWERNASSFVPLQSSPSPMLAALHSWSQMPSPTYLSSQLRPTQQKQSGPHLPRITPLHTPSFPVHRPPTLSQCCARIGMLLPAEQDAPGPVSGCGMSATVFSTFPASQSQCFDWPCRGWLQS